MNPLLWGTIDAWISGLSGSDFDTVLPLVRRTFATFPAGERRQMGDRVRTGAAAGGRSPVDGDEQLDVERANLALPTLARIFGIEWP
jgi:hypothetical protein